MTNLKNESYWSEVEELPVFSSKEQAWGWLEKLQKERRLNARDILAIKELLNLSYQAGFEEAIRGQRE